MHSLWHWILHVLCWASADPAVLEHERARCAGAVAVAYAALAAEPTPTPRREELVTKPMPEHPRAEVPQQLPPLPPAAPCLQCSGTGRIYRSDGGWVRCPCQCPDGKCQPKR